MTTQDVIWKVRNATRRRFHHLARVSARMDRKLEGRMNSKTVVTPSGEIKKMSQ